MYDGQSPHRWLEKHRDVIILTVIKTVTIEITGDKWSFRKNRNYKETYITRIWFLKFLFREEDLENLTHRGHIEVEIWGGDSK